MANSSFIYHLNGDEPSLAKPYLVGLDGVREVDWSTLLNLSRQVGAIGAKV